MDIIYQHHINITDVIMGLKHMGLRKKILAGFIGIAIILLFTGIASLVELEKLSKSTQALIDSSSKNMQATQIILDAVNDQNVALLHMIMLSSSAAQDSLFNLSKKHFDAALAEAAKVVTDPAELAPVLTASISYEIAVKGYRNRSREENVAWFIDIYKGSYSTFTETMKVYMSESQSAVSLKTLQLEKSAYRASTPNIITIAVLGVIIGMFLFFVDRYFIKPILHINRGLNAYLTNKIPFSVKVESDDEIQSLRDGVERLIMLYKNKKSE